MVKPGDIVFGDADGVIVLPDNFEDYLAAAEKMTGNEKRRAVRVAEEGYKFLRRDDVDIVKFFERDKEAVIAHIKEECRY